jgi:hypothetical protein
MSTRVQTLAALVILIASVVITQHPARAAPPFEIADIACSVGSTRYLALRGSGGTNNVGVATLLFAGGNGLITIGNDGSVTGPVAENFLVRSREKFIDAGIRFVAVVGVPFTYTTGLDGDIRLSDTYALCMKAVIADIQQRSHGLPVWVIGTSAGALSAVSVAARLVTTPQRPAGVVLPSPQMRADTDGGCNRTVFHLGDAGLVRVVQPTFIVYNKGDKCVCSDPPFIAPLFHKLGTNVRATLGLTSTAATSGVCDAHAPHGFYKIEKATVGTIVNWIRNPVTINAPAKFP